MQISYDQMMAFLSIAALAMGIVLLYHLIVISLSLRRIVKRADAVSNAVVSIIMKPLVAADSAMEWFIHFLEGLNDQRSAKHAKHAKRKHVEEEEATVV